LSGAISRGEHILAAQALGADFAYIGTRFIATKEAAANPEYKQALVDSSAADIVYSPYFTGVHGNYLRSSIVKQGLDPENLPVRDKSTMQLGASDAPVKAWKDIWGAGQGVGSIDAVDSTAELIARMKAEYTAARARLSL
jgi:nitronate monooxygenase